MCDDNRFSIVLTDSEYDMLSETSPQIDQMCVAGYTPEDSMRCAKLVDLVDCSGAKIVYNGKVLQQPSYKSVDVQTNPTSDSNYLCAIQNNGTPVDPNYGTRPLSPVEYTALVGQTNNKKLCIESFDFIDCSTLTPEPPPPAKGETPSPTTPSAAEMSCKAYLANANNTDIYAQYIACKNGTAKAEDKEKCKYFKK